MECPTAKTMQSAGGPVVVRYLPSPDDGQPADVYLHGAAGSWTTFRPLLPHNPAAGRAVVLIDLPGWGDSTPAPGVRSVDLGRLADAVTEVLLGLGLSSWRLIGHSMGGFLALHLAAIRPQNCVAVVVLSGAGIAAARACRSPVRGLFEFPALTGMLLAMRLAAALGPAGTRLLRAVGRSKLMPLLMAPFFARPKLIPRSVIDALALDARPLSFVAAARIAVRYDFGLWRNIGCPVLATRGSTDIFTPARELDWLCQLVPQTRTEIIADCGHFAPVEQPVATARLLHRVGWHAPVHADARAVG